MTDLELKNEISRLEKMELYESEIRGRGYSLIAGIDEVGRGPLAGPVVSAAIILNANFIPIGVNDSKKVSEKKRTELFEILKANCVSYGIGIVDEKIIDEINILNAVKLSMKIAIEAMKIPPDFLLTDAITLDNVNIPQKSIIKGDSLSVSIASASIIAKVSRDRIMLAYDRYYPDYGFAKHKGYGTKAHFEAIKKIGISPIHRVSYIHI
jgi:ribonuclease HII